MVSSAIDFFIGVLFRNIMQQSMQLVCKTSKALNVFKFVMDYTERIGRGVVAVVIHASININMFWTLEHDVKTKI